MKTTQTPLIITIDGPAGVGKSTLAGRVADALGIAYLDTGAMFRTAALRLTRAGFSPEAGPAPDARFDEVLASCVFALEGTGSGTRLLCGGVEIGDEIRSEEAGMMAARFGQLPELRAFLKAAQQGLGERFSLVAEGRDMGTVVFPGAQCKIFLDASPEVRAKRRYLQLKARGEEPDLAALTEQIRQRDEQDRKRAVAPLKAAEDARVIDTTAEDIDQVFAGIMAAVESALAAAAPRHPMRRKDRLMVEDETRALLERAEYGVLALDEGSGWPYAVPLSFAFMDGALYFHCARDGRKIRALDHNSRVCFTVVGATQPVYDGSFSTYYESVMVFGRARLVEEEEEKYRALTRLAEKYLPADMDKADKDIRHSFNRTALYRISLDSVSGKAKRPKKPK